MLLKDGFATALSQKIKCESHTCTRARYKANYWILYGKQGTDWSYSGISIRVGVTPGLYRLNVRMRAGPSLEMENRHSLVRRAFERTRTRPLSIGNLLFLREFVPGLLSNFDALSRAKLLHVKWVPIACHGTHVRSLKIFFLDPGNYIFSFFHQLFKKNYV